MGKKKGLSLEEKRQKLLDIYYDKKEVLNLKEIEKWGAKKGVGKLNKNHVEVLQSVKEVNQSLVDDNLVETDKIGAGAFFWALPSKGFQTRKNLIEDYDKKIEKCKQETEEIKASIEKAQSDRCDDDGFREKMIQELAQLQKEKASYDAELKTYERSDPKQLLKMEENSKIAKDACNRWTDNLYLIMQWIQASKPGLTQKELEKSFPIYKDLDYVE